ncbi:MAG: diguanylate cyclase [Pseudomonadales bacterium]|nr:diguanylate cyclase [Pseudomonadales bacterium]
MSQFIPTQEFLEFIVDRINVGVFIVDKECRVLLWNKYMANHSSKKETQVYNENLFELFPDLPQKWFRKKIESVFMLKAFAFTSWEQRPYLFKFPHSRPITGGVEFMNQDLTLMPVKDESGEVVAVCITLLDVTDVSVYQTMLKEAMIEVEIASQTDGLTGLYNRAHWEKRLLEEFNRVKRYGSTMTLLMFDLDDFKLVNDTYGHLAGDAVLRGVSKHISDTLRENDIAGRYGGEEFAIVLPATDLEGAVMVAERLRKQICNMPVTFDKNEISVSVSIGLAEYNAEADSHEKLIAQADAALYSSKEQGRNQSTSFQVNLPS